MTDKKMTEMDYYHAEEEEYWEKFTLSDVPEYIKDSKRLTEFDENEFLALHRAAKSCKDSKAIEAMVDATIKAGLSVDVRDTIEQTTPLHCAARYNHPNGSDQHLDYNEVLEVIRAFLDKGADVNAKSKDGKTPLHFLAMGIVEPVVLEFILDRGADVLAEDNNGKIPLYYAKKEDSILFLHVHESFVILRDATDKATEK